MPDDKPVDVETLRNALADLEDAKHRVRRDADRQVVLLKADVLQALVPVLDNLARSIDAAETTRQVDPLLDGVKLVEAQLLRVLGDFGLERVSSVGQRFDPKLHDAVAVVPVADPQLDGVVVAEVEA